MWPRYHDLYNRIVEEGHQVGNHTFHHLGSLKHMAITYGQDVSMANEPHQGASLPPASRMDEI